MLSRFDTTKLAFIKGTCAQFYTQKTSERKWLKRSQSDDFSTLHPSVLHWTKQNKRGEIAGKTWQMLVPISLLLTFKDDCVRFWLPELKDNRFFATFLSFEFWLFWFPGFFFSFSKISPFWSCFHFDFSDPGLFTFVYAFVSNLNHDKNNKRKQVANQSLCLWCVV